MSEQRKYGEHDPAILAEYVRLDVETTLRTSAMLEEAGIVPEEPEPVEIDPADLAPGAVFDQLADAFLARLMRDEEEPDSHAWAILNAALAALGRPGVTVE